MAKIQDYFKIITPKPNVTTMADSQNMGDQNTYANTSWYQKLVVGSASRISRYREYEQMDGDVEIARSLDTIAEEMIGSDPNSDLPLELVIHKEKEQDIPTSVVMTLRTALRYWSDLHDWTIRLFKVARVTIKYGDCFFLRKKETMKWEYIIPKHVIAAIVDERDVTRVIGWQIKQETKAANSAYSQQSGGYSGTSNEIVETYPADDVIWFTLNDDISDSAPFGESILRAIYRAQKQKELLEDAIIIYRIQRAPERRVFYIDVGKMPPQRVKSYLESIKNEIRQRKIPTFGGGVEQVDSVYNPQSMCLALDTEIPLLDGRTVSLQTMINEHNNGKQNWVYSVNPVNGEVVPGMVYWAGITQYNTETIKLTLDNGETIICTPEHKFPVQGKGKVEAKDLTPNDSLWSFNIRKEKINKSRGDEKTLYTKVYNPKTKAWIFVHRLVANYIKGKGIDNSWTYDEQYDNEPKNTIHHKNFDSLNNNPDNLVFMNGNDHCKYHHSLNNNQEAIFTDKLIDRFHELANQNIEILFDDLLKLLNSDKEFMTEYQQSNIRKEGTKFKLKTTKFRQKMFLVFIEQLGYKNWKQYQNAQVVAEIQKINSMPDWLGSEFAQDQINLIQFVIDLIKKVSIHNFAIVTYLKDNVAEREQFVKLYRKVFVKSDLTLPDSSAFERVAKLYGYTSFKHLIKEAYNFNHRVVKIEKWYNQDVGTLTIDQEHKFHDFHTFATKSVYVYNSEDFFFSQRPDGKGSRVETLPGGQGLGQLDDLEYFQAKVFRGLRIPLSYMREGQDNSVFNDGKTGVAYIQELRFAMYIKRLQNYVARVIDKEFKRYLRMTGINVDPTIFKISLPEPENFGIYRQQQLDTDLLGTYSTANGIEHLSKRFSMQKYLQLTDEEILINERLRSEELGLDPDNLTKDDMLKLYGPQAEPGMDMGTGMVAGSLAGSDLGVPMGGMDSEMGTELGADVGTNPVSPTPVAAPQ
ncbi:MAG: portal protein [Nitrososphaeraceae archaeon]